MKYALSALFLSGLAMAVPMADKRDVKVDVVVETVWTTTTIYVDGKSAGNFAEHASTSSSAAASASASSSSAVVIPSSAPAPAPSSVAAPAAPSPSPQAPPAAAPSVAAPAAAAPSVAAPPAAAPPASGAGSVAGGTGDATYYDVSVGAGSCGTQASNGDSVVALSYLDMNNGANPNQNPLCGKTITISYGGSTFTGKVYDTCMGCAKGSIDLAQGWFPTVFPTGDGRVHGVSWSVN